MDNYDFGLTTKDDLAIKFNFNNEMLQAKSKFESPTAPSLNYLILNDLQQYLDQTNNSDLFLEILFTYREEAQQKLIELEQSIASLDLERLQIITHSLKGSSTTLGIMKFASFCIALEQLCVEKSIEQSKLVDLLNQLKEEFKHISNLLFNHS
ncbi:MAG: Hpt domain-containing protein [Blastocatellia bacterium]|nr:Hpt domain-containing protein [Blastocatellia bacterium]MBL8196353.1 Hpt domain-containing protein [Blastocatellia bacterium]MBN8724587.1 Hpt domain-containing protein [Acidobacteriota bacterium]